MPAGIGAPAKRVRTYRLEAFRFILRQVCLGMPTIVRVTVRIGGSRPWVPGRTVQLHPQEALLQQLPAPCSRARPLPSTGNLANVVVEHRPGAAGPTGSPPVSLLRPHQNPVPAVPWPATVANLTLVAAKAGLSRRNRLRCPATACPSGRFGMVNSATAWLGRTWTLTSRDGVPY